MKLNYDRKLKYSLGILVTVVILLSNSPALTQPTAISANEVEVNNLQKYYFGLLRTSAPISYYDDQSANWKGYCYALIETLRERKFPNIEIVEMVRDNRFKGEGSNNIKLDAECGPNTITPERKRLIRLKDLKGYFSETFGWTGATALLLKENMQKLSPGNEFKTLKFGLIYGTSTIDIVKNAYPSLEDRKIVTLKDANDAINKLRTGEVDVYFNDEMLLMRILKKLNRLIHK
ncbi:transporter substrate-binding domain-containing protein [Nostoc sp.]|uniref:transporter substrate-binding domain-containing protein n=1 Tax=Nostoc sp. TaxID=1180 RepID=UPI002FF653F1